MRLYSIKEKRIAAIISVVLLITAVLFYTNLKIKTEVNMINVAYTVKDIPPRTQITKDMIKIRQRPGQAIPPNALVNAKDIIGKYTVSGYGVPTNSFVYKDKVVSEQQLPDAGNRTLKANQVSFPLLVDIESSLGNSIMPDSYVDLYFRGEVDNNSQNKVTKNPIYGKLVSHVRVVSVKDQDAANVFDGESYTKDNSSSMTNGNKKHPMAKIYVFAVDENANKILNNAKTLGQVVPVASGKSYTDETSDKDSVQKNDVVKWIQSQTYNSKLALNKTDSQTVNLNLVNNNN